MNQFAKIFILNVSIIFFIGFCLISVVLTPNPFYKSASAVFDLFLTSPRQNDNQNAIEDLPITFARSGYEPISFFDDEAKAFLTYQILDGYSAVIEPYSNMELYINTKNKELKNSSYYYSICSSTVMEECVEGDHSQGLFLDYPLYCIVKMCRYLIPYVVGTYSIVMDGDEAEVVTTSVLLECTPYESFIVTVYEIDETTSDVLATKVFNALCLYVRRDIEDLTDDDLKETLDTMHALWEYDEDEGQELFGTSFHSALYFSDGHHFNAAQMSADHIHEGLGFLSQHIKLSQMFESSMQAVNPKVTLPYWEFTKTAARNETVFDSMMFTSDTFGSLYRPENEFLGFTYTNNQISQGAIPNGRWANLTVNKNDRFDDIVNAYGYMSAPWNLNPSPFVTRFANYYPSLPTCKSVYDVLASSDMMEFLKGVQRFPHASLHAVLGNTFGCDQFGGLLKNGLISDYNTMGDLCRIFNYLVKDLYRAKYLKPLTSCSVSMESFLENPNGVECGYECDDSLADDMVSQVEAMFGRYASKSIDSTGWKIWRDFICNGDAKKIMVGTHMESSSAADPSFWPAHPTQERIYHARVLSTLENNSSYVWPSDFLKEYVCDNTYCYDADRDAKGSFSCCCEGHYEHNQLLDFVSGDASKTMGPTNGAILESSNPTLSSYSMPYIYDNFEWNHCHEDIQELLEVQHTAATS